MRLSKCFSRNGMVIMTIICFVGLLTILAIGIAMQVSTSISIHSDKYSPSKCILTASSVITIAGPPAISYCSATKYITVWKTSDGLTAINSPLTASINQLHSQDQLNDYPLNTLIDCLCNTKDYIAYPNVDGDIACVFFASCFLDIPTVNFIQSQVYFTNIGIYLTIFASSALTLIIAFSIASCFCANDICRRQYYVDLDAVTTSSHKQDEL